MIEACHPDARLARGVQQCNREGPGHWAPGPLVSRVLRGFVRGARVHRLGSAHPPLQGSVRAPGRTGARNENPGVVPEAVEQAA